VFPCRSIRNSAVSFSQLGERRLDVIDFEEAYQQQTGLPLDPSLIRMEAA
jgi:hypothetical protein